MQAHHAEMVAVHNAEVVDDVSDDALLALAGAHELFYRRPAFAQNGPLEVVEPLRLLLEPVVDRLL